MTTRQFHGRYRRILMIHLVLLVVAAVLHLFGSISFCGMVASLIYLGLLISWGLSVWYRILMTGVRRMLLLSAGLMLLWMLLRIMRYDFFGTDLSDAYAGISRLLWYAYYVPQVFIPPLIFGAVLFSNRDDRRARRLLHVCLLPALLLAVGFLTNDLHELAFSFPDPLRWETAYSHEILYYLYIVWYALFFILSTVVTLRYSGGFGHKAVKLLPMVFPLLMIPYTVYYLFGPFLLLTYFLEYPEAFCLAYVGYVECCIVLGFIPSNTGYVEIFERSGLPLLITTPDGRRAFSSGDTSLFTPDVLTGADEAGTLACGEGKEILSIPVTGGKAYYLIDRSGIQSLNAALAENVELLAGEAQLLRAERELKERSARLETQNALYDAMAHASGRAVEKLNLLLADVDPTAQDFPDSMRKACILGAYIKRRSNLTILCHQTETVDARELGLALKESADYLTFAGVPSSCGVCGQGEISSAQAARLYDAFEDVLETRLDDLTDLLITLRVGKDSCSLELQMEGKGLCGVTEETLVSPGILLGSEEQDGTLYVTLTLSKEGVV